jgi:hypothetical protein
MLSFPEFALWRMSQTTKDSQNIWPQDHKHLSEQPAVRPRHEPETSWIRNKIANHYTITFGKNQYHNTPTEVKGGEDM